VLAAPEQDPPAVGDAAAIEAGVEVRSGAVSPYEALADVKPVAVGAGVRTDNTGYAEISYLDGSKTRLDIDTEFEVVELINGAAHLHWTNHRALSVGTKVVTIGDDGSRSESIVVSVQPAIARSRALGLAVVIGGVPVQPPPPAPPRWVEAAFQDDAVAAALRILADPDVAWAGCIICTTSWRLMSGQASDSGRLAESAICSHTPRTADSPSVTTRGTGIPSSSPRRIP
jgi:hypothetical protein